jgi:hypothetical protein
MKKIVINTCYGGFGLSEEVMQWLRDRGIKGVASQIKRDNLLLVEAVEKFGTKAGDMFAELKIVSIPNNVEWEIQEYDGIEWVAEKHRTWS